MTYADLKNSAEYEEIAELNHDDLKKFIHIANRLNVPYYVVIGNHEVFKSQNLDKKEYLRIDKASQCLIIGVARHILLIVNNTE